MVTDKVAYIGESQVVIATHSVCLWPVNWLIINQIILCCPSGTSNWSGDYFMTTAGVGLVISQHAPQPVWKTKALQGQLRAVFDRDWYSQFSVAIADLGQNPDCAL